MHEWKSNRNNMKLSLIKHVLEPQSVFSGIKTTHFDVRDVVSEKMAMMQTMLQNQKQNLHWFMVGSQIMYKCVTE